jgi:hypothetical protein
MFEEEFYDYSDYYDVEEWPRDVKIDEAKESLKSFFRQNPQAVFYIKQLEVTFEKQFFHWITAKAIRELIEEGRLKMEEVPLAKGTRVKFVFNPRYRYYKRAIKKAIHVIREYSHHEIAMACGEQADVLFFNALIAKGFSPHGQDINEFKGKKWLKTNHDLDFIIEKDRIVYGCEVKNTFDYIDKDELFIKLEICEYLGLRPLFIMRYSPKSYNFEIIKRGGYAMIFEKQIYPFGQAALVKKITGVLGMPVDCPRAIPEGIINRFMNWHNKHKV